MESSTEVATETNEQLSAPCAMCHVRESEWLSYHDPKTRCPSLTFCTPCKDRTIKYWYDSTLDTMAAGLEGMMFHCNVCNFSFANVSEIDRLTIWEKISGATDCT